MFNKIINKINNIKKENKIYQNLLNNSSKFTGLIQLPNLNNPIIEGKIATITEMCPDINKNKAIIINKLIPLDETYLTINYTKELITNIDYWIITTNKYIWIINEHNYGIMNYQNIAICEIIKNNIMSKTINLNNIILEINGNNENINKLINILNDYQYREKIITEKTKYLCDIIPIKQLINNIHSGISIDNNKNIVFHTKEFNYKYNISEIKNYEILMDNNHINGKNESTKTYMSSMPTSCYTISIRITTNNTSFLIPILEPNSINTKYTNKDQTFINNLNFAKEIIESINNLENN